ncbi:hypothetical protein H4582DRAFT_1935410 [Lactarius indigo]|nr:hypothetical protein H4582DRAFT_1935410 [Lactarius indigo]
MATVPPDTSYPQPDPDEPPHILFDDPDADVILHSGDSHIFRVLKIYIIRSSTVLGKLIQAASNTSKSGAAKKSASARTRLPEVQLSDSSAILSCLLTFIFPVPSVLPSSLDQKMELLSVAQKYDMSSVMDHIRGSLSQQDPPFIHRENAFLAYSLAQKYGLRHEAIQAARLTLKFTLTIEKFEDVMPGAYLHELWKYHQRVRAQLKFDTPSCDAGAVLNGFRCHQYAPHPPSWTRSYIMSISENPSFFDPIEFQMALMRHTTGTVSKDSGGTVAGCPLCVHIPAETMRTFWTTLTVVVHRSMEKAESGLSVLGTNSNPQNHVGLPAISFPLPECLDISEADIVVRSSDCADFLVHKAILASSSPVFRDMFSLPQSPNSETVGGLAMVEISEDAELVRSLITILYPIPSEIPASYDRVLALLAAAQKYDMKAVQSSIRDELARRQPPVLDGAQAFRAYAIASSSGLIPEMNTAASLTLDYPMTFEHLGDDLRLFEGWALHDLSNFRKGCRDQLVSCFESFLDTLEGPSRIWINCPGHKTQSLTKDAPALPTWVHDFFSQQIEELKQDFTRPLVKPSIIRSKYLRAMLEHAAYRYPGKCTFCLEKHATNGEDYCVQLERAIARAREETPLKLT